MQLRLLFSVLLCSSTLYAMELTITSTSCVEKITDDLFTTAIGSRLDRPARDALRRTSTKYFKLILSQDELNENYKNACLRWDNPQIVHWKSMGGLLSHQEFANAIQNKKNSLGTWLLEKNKVVVWDVYCRNIQDAIATSTIEEMLPVIKWLLDSRMPKTHLGEFLSGYHCAKNLIAQYPEVQKIVDVFEVYEQDKDYRERAASYNGPYFGSRRSWHLRDGR